MSSEIVLPSDLVPIKDVNDEHVQDAGRSAVEANNEWGGHCFVYKRVVNGRSEPIIEFKPKFYITVIEVINDDGIPWSYIAKVQHFGLHKRAPFVLSYPLYIY